MADSDIVDLEELLDKEITVHLKGGEKMEGTLTDYDDYMNMVLRKVKEIKRNDSVREHDLVVVKGGNAKSITI